MTTLRALLLAALLPLAACAQPSRAAEATPAQLRGFPEATLTITHSRGRDRFRVWVADSPPRQQQGLMFVRAMPADRGMVFPLAPPRPMSMWMKNTYIPLDMLFVDPDRRISHIAAGTRPHSLETIDSPGPVAAVIELNAGEAKRRGLAIGDRVELLPTIR